MIYEIVKINYVKESIKRYPTYSMIAISILSIYSMVFAYFILERIYYEFTAVAYIERDSLLLEDDYKIDLSYYIDRDMNINIQILEIPSLENVYGAFGTNRFVRKGINHIEIPFHGYDRGLYAIDGPGFCNEKAYPIYGKCDYVLKLKESEDYSFEFHNSGLEVSLNDHAYLVIRCGKDKLGIVKSKGQLFIDTCEESKLSDLHVYYLPEWLLITDIKSVQKLEEYITDNQDLR